LQKKNSIEANARTQLLMNECGVRVRDRQTLIAFCWLDVDSAPKLRAHFSHCHTHTQVTARENRSVAII
jgi:hypothetical protein